MKRQLVVISCIICILPCIAWTQAKMESKFHEIHSEQVLNASDNYDSVITQQWKKVPKQWVNTEKITTQYNAKGVKVIREYYKWNKTGSRWNIENRLQYNYLPEGGLAGIISHFPNSKTGLPEPYMKLEIERDSTGKKVAAQSILWNKKEGAWKNVHKCELNYDTISGKITSIYKYNISKDSIHNKEGRVIRNYEANGKLRRQSNHGWSKEKNGWVHISSLSNSYDSTDNLIHEYKRQWNTELNQWDGAYKYQHTFNVQGGKSKTIAYKYGIEQWEPDFYLTYSYDQADLLAKVVRTTNNAEGEPEPEQKIVKYTYSPEGALVKEETVKYNSDSQVELPISRKVYYPKKN